MRLVLVNPHYHGYGVSVVNFLLRRKSFKKYDYFLEYFLKDPTRETAIYIDGTKTSLATIGITFPVFRSFFIRIEVFLWMLINKINPFQQTIYERLSDLDPATDIVVDFARTADVGQIEKQAYQGIVFILFTHYFLKTEEIAAFLHTIRFALVAAENDLSNDAYFQKFFPSIKATYRLPFTYASRFVSRVPFLERENKCFAIGTICPIEKNNHAFHAHFGNIDTLHPMRKEIHEHRKEITNEIVSYVRPYKSFSSIRDIESQDSQFMRYMKKYGPAMLLKMLLVRQHDRYFKFDIVEKYNTYRMFVSPEEAVGLPSINVFEGMAAGSAFVGIIHPMYTELGLIPGVHYIGYEEGNLEDMLSQIRYYQAHPKELQVIAEEGRRYVIDNFNKKKVAEVLWGDLDRISKEFQISQVASTESSFTKNNT